MALAFAKECVGRNSEAYCAMPNANAKRRNTLRYCALPAAPPRLRGTNGESAFDKRKPPGEPHCGQ